MTRSAAVFLLLSLFLFPSCSGKPNMAPNKKLVVIGMDGLDPIILQRMMDQGQLPNFKKMADGGSFSSLGTSNPPQSPVAWSCFISGEDPGHHDVFDFIARDPKTHIPEIGMTQTKKTEKKSL